MESKVSDQNHRSGEEMKKGEEIPSWRLGHLPGNFETWVQILTVTDLEQHLNLDLSHLSCWNSLNTALFWDEWFSPKIQKDFYKNILKSCKCSQVGNIIF